MIDLRFKSKLVDLREVPLDVFPTPPDGYRWDRDTVHVMLTDDKHECIKWDLLGGCCYGYADIDVVWFFLNALQSVSALHVIADKNHDIVVDVVNVSTTESLRVDDLVLAPKIKQRLQQFSFTRDDIKRIR
jgi:hypothetical protein